MSGNRIKRHRSLRSSAAMRSLVRETRVSVEDVIYPLFIVEGSGLKRPIASLPGVYQFSLDRLGEELSELARLGIRGVILFGIPLHKDALASGAFDEAGIVQRAIKLIKEGYPELLVIADTCLCGYTDHGHCGLVADGVVDNDASLDLLSKTAVAQAKAGADVIAPSNMMDGCVVALRAALDEAGYEGLPIMSYAVKYASAFYGPFREAAGSSPQFGDRKTYQMDSANRREAWKEALTDVEAGADFLIVKPGLAYLDIVSDVKAATNVPVIAYNVSGEYAMVKAAAEKGWLVERDVVMEMVTGMKRAGADVVITYFAKDIARYVKELEEGVE